MNDEFVCDECFGDVGLKAFAAGNAVSCSCCFCGREEKEPIAAPIEEIAAHIDHCIRAEYDEAVNCLSWESAEGGYIGITWDTYDLLSDELALDLPNDDGALLDAIVRQLEYTDWCKTDPFGLNYVEQAMFSWRRFSETVKHKRRFFFTDYEVDLDDDTWSPGETLRRILDYARSTFLLTTVDAGLRLYRARPQKEGEHFESTADLGPPPMDKATQTNRMSPPGIVMMYASDRIETALRETASVPGSFAVGVFKTRRDAVILDLCRVPPVPSLFQEVSDTLEYNPRPVLSFLHHVVRQMSEPIARDDRVHIDYVPTQVVTEYVRAYRDGDRSIDGIRYPSAVHPGGRSYVLFATQDSLLPAPAQEESLIRHGEDRWLELVGRSDEVVTASMLDIWQDVAPSTGTDEDE